jgi:hypothetical protein
VVVIVIGVAGMHMRRLPAVDMIGQGVRRFRVFLFGHLFRCFAARLHPPRRIERQ